MKDSKPRRIRLSGVQGGATSPTGDFLAVNATAHGMGPITIEWPHEALTDVIAAVLLATEMAGRMRGDPDPLQIGSTVQARTVHTIQAGVASTRADVLLQFGISPQAQAQLSLVLSPEVARELIAHVQAALESLRRSAI